MRFLGFLFSAVLAMQANHMVAQDILVTNEGESMKVYNIEIGQSAVFYQLEDRPDADTKRIAKKDVMIIRKKDGTKIDPNLSEQNPTPSTRNISAPALAANPNLAEDNLKAVRAFNSRKVNWTSDNDKKANNQLYQIAIKEGSIIETPELSASFKMKCWKVKTNFTGKKILKEYISDEIKVPLNHHPLDPAYPALEVILTNKLDKTIFIDLGNSFFIVYGKSSAYYHPESTSTTSGSSGGAGVNLGSIANAAGIGGTLGTLAGGVNVGGGSSSSTTKVKYSQRVISIPPHSSYAMDAQKLLTDDNQWILFDFVFDKNEELIARNGWRKKKYYEWSDEFTKGTIAEFPAPENLMPFSVFITYSPSESLQETATINAGFYVNRVYSLSTKDNIDLSESPLVFWGERW